MSLVDDDVQTPAERGGPVLSALPIIDISPFLHHEDGHGRISTAAAIHAACLEYGFFYLDISKFVDWTEPEE